MYEVCKLSDETACIHLEMVFKSFLLVACLLVSATKASPFYLTQQYVEEFEHGLDELKQLSKTYEYHQADFLPENYSEKQTETDTEEFDFIVIGSGDSGAVIASRLSEIPEWKVLVLEAGVAETKFTQVPAVQTHLETTPYDWWHTTVSQNKSCLGMEENKCAIHAGKSLGGNSATNDMLYTRGNHKDYDIWADLGLDGWCWNDVLPYFKKIEDAHMHDLDRKYHNLGGPLHLEHFQHESGIAQNIFDGGHELGIKTVDYNGEHQLGLGIPQAITKKGRRNSVSEAYLIPADKRKNLVVRPLSQVVKIVISPHTKEAYAVKYIHDGHLYVVKAAKEIILAAGAINTPQLLLLSEVQELDPRKTWNISRSPPVADLKVGHNLKDHIAFVGLNFVFNETAKEVHEGEDSVVDYLKNAKGPLTTAGAEVLGFLKTEISKDKSDYPDVELLITMDLYNKGSRRRCTTPSGPRWKARPASPSPWCCCTPSPPESSPCTTKTPSTTPLINPNYLEDEENHDVDTLLAGIHKALKLAHTESLQKLGIHLNHNQVPGCEHEDVDAYWKCAIRHLSVSLRGVSGTARMGRETDKAAVVDHQLRVHGVHKLRVADASVIPVSISGHLTAPTIMIGEKAADLIKEHWK
ncbi:hypothetical protein NQ318_002292 [Aromia moschata]|uniref:Uncharacterized protein n=1 Tax=Aromia moschata TaxID=1265417 RepID=A0AAV8Z4J9_9CUCU|nr:hypothetical protein NQ318_002292 [Aromia moschata]